MENLTFFVEGFFYLVIVPVIVVAFPLLAIAGFFKFIEKFFPNIQKY